MVYRPTVPPAGLDTDGLRRWTEDEFRNVARGLNDFGALFDPTPRGYIAGLTLSTAGASITFTCAAGVARDSTNVGDLVLAAALAKTTAAWAVGNAAGSFDGTGLRRARRLGGIMFI